MTAVMKLLQSRLAVSGAVFLAMVAVIAAVWGFEHFGGYIPCALCLEQRQPYYWAIPIAFVAVAVASTRKADWAVRGALVIVGLLAAYSAALGAYHSGVEWGLWAGPADCAAVAGGPAVSLSAEKYCSASIMMEAAGVDVTHSHTIEETA